MKWILAAVGLFAATPATAQEALPMQVLETDLAPFRIARIQDSFCDIYLRYEGGPAGSASLSLIPSFGGAMGVNVTLQDAVIDVGSEARLLLALHDEEGNVLTTSGGNARLQDLRQTAPSIQTSRPFEMRPFWFLNASIAQNMPRAHTIVVVVGKTAVIRQEIPGGGAHLWSEYQRCEAL